MTVLCNYVFSIDYFTCNFVVKDALKVKNKTVCAHIYIDHFEGRKGERDISVLLCMQNHLVYKKG